MALSEHEQRMLDQIEQALFADDPKFASTVNVSKMRRRRPVLAVTLAVLGLLALVGGAIVATLVLPAAGIPLAVVGFIAMVAGVGLLVYGVPGKRGGSGGQAPSKKVASPLSSRMEERFRRRFDA